MAVRRLVPAAAALLGLALATGAGARTATTISAVSVPRLVLPGQHVTITARVQPSGIPCDLLVRFADGTLQVGIPTRTSRPGRTVWRFTIEDDAPTGPARAVVSCNRLNALQTFSVRAAPVPHVNVSVLKKGFSQRGGSVSYGAVLHVTSADEDAREVTVLVNVADSANRLLGSAQTSVAVIPAGGTFDLGGALTLRVPAQAARIEVVVRARAAAVRPFRAPETRNVAVVPSTADAQWVGEVDGELDNTRTDATLTGARITVVLLDAAGNVLGGGAATSTLALPPSTRGFFTVAAGVGAVQSARVASAEVSVVPTYANG
jgi:hypothetical protein